MLDFFDLDTPERKEERKAHEEKLKREKQAKIQRAVQEKNIEFDLRPYTKHQEGETIQQEFTLFLCTKVGILDLPDTLGRRHFKLYENVNLDTVFVAAKRDKRIITGHADKLLHIERTYFDENYRGFGLSTKLNEAFFDLYLERFSDYPISVEFVNPLAEYVMQKTLREKNMSHLLNESLIQRYYNANEHADLLRSLKDKDNAIFPLESHAYMS